MIASISAELLILRKRASTWILLGIWAALGAFFAYIVPYVTFRNDGPQGGQSLSELLPEQLVGNIIAGFPFYGGVIALMLGVLSFGSDYGWGTLKTLFTQRGGRTELFAAKLAALAIVLVPFVLVEFVVGATGSAVIAGLEDSAIDWPSLSLLARGLLSGWFILAVWTALGMLLATLSRGTALAIGIGILYALVIEGLLIAFARQVSFLDWLVEMFVRANAYSLIRSLNPLIEGDGPGAFSGPFVSGGQAFVLLAAYLACFVALSAVVLRRRDVA
jgi:ABC-type transport system involved in multi-copper enzyme maturation permease subunit